MARSPKPHDGMTRKELDIGDSDLSLDPVGLLDDPDDDETEVDDLPESPGEMLDRCLGRADGPSNERSESDLPDRADSKGRD